MHEASLIESMLALATAETRKAGAGRILRIRLRVGALSGVVPEALEFAFEALRTDTPAATATLEIERVPSRFRCTACGAEVERDEMDFACEACGGLLAVQSGGTELELAQLEVQ